MRWDKRDTKPANSYIFFYGNRNGSHNLVTSFSVQKEILIAATKSDHFYYMMSKKLIGIILF